MTKMDRAIGKTGRELLCWGDEVCVCFHSEGAHEYDVCLGLAGPNLDNDCKCTEYHPKDNLVFLEYKSKEIRRGRTRKNKNRS
jgi:hypothetical protein